MRGTLPISAGDMPGTSWTLYIDKVVTLIYYFRYRPLMTSLSTYFKTTSQDLLTTAVPTLILDPTSFSFGHPIFIQSSPDSPMGRR